MVAFEPGGDQKAISQIAQEVYGGYRELFDAHGWEWVGSNSMAQSATLIKNFYGSIESFVKYQGLDGLPEDPFEATPSAYIKAFHGFDPPSWGCVGWKLLTRLETISDETSSPFIMAIWVTTSAKKENAAMRGRVVGFYELSHETGPRASYMEPWQDEAHKKGKWEHSFRARRAWEILPDFQPKLKDFYPEVITGKRSQATGNWSESLPELQVEKLKKLPRREVQVFGVNRAIKADLFHPAPKKGKGYVRGGTFRRASYEVGEPKNTEKELYILKLSGNVDAYLGYSGGGKSIFKVGLSLSPVTRLNALNSALPAGDYVWKPYKRTKKDKHEPYSSFEVAEEGEMAIKKFLGENPGSPDFHLGGEFYLASKKEIESAWKLGREIALKAESNQHG